MTPGDGWSCARKRTLLGFYSHLVIRHTGLAQHALNMHLISATRCYYVAVRLAAFDHVFLGKRYTPKIMRYILPVMADDSRVVRRHVARGVCQSLALLVSMGEIKTSREADSLMIEKDGNGGEKVKENKKSELDLVIKALHKDREVGKNEMIQELLMPIVL